MRILHIVAPSRYGGLERVVESLVSGQARRGHDVGAAVVLDSHERAAHPLVTNLDRPDIRVFPVPLAPRQYMQERGAIARICRQFKPDFVHTHGYRADVVDSSVARKLGLATVTTVHGFTGGDLKNRFYEKLQRLSFRRFDAVVAVSDALASSLLSSGFPRSRLHTLPNAYDSLGGRGVLNRDIARRELRVPQNCFHIGWVGRISYEKGLDQLLVALRRLVDLPLLASIFGEGPERSMLEARSRSLGVDRRIVWRGMVPDASRLFRSFDVFVLSSRNEGIPIVLFEAMFAEVPIVATRVGGVPEVVSENEAVLVAPGDTDSLAAAIGSIYESPDDARGRCRAARERLESTFALEPWLAQYEEVYRLVIGQREERKRR